MKNKNKLQEGMFDSKKPSVYTDKNQLSNVISTVGDKANVYVVKDDSLFEEEGDEIEPTLELTGKEHTDNLIKALVKYSNYHKGVVRTNNDGEKYRFDKYLLKYKSANNFLVQLFKKAAVENGFDDYVVTFNSGDEYYFSFKRPKFRGQPNGTMDMQKLVIMGYDDTGITNESVDAVIEPQDQATIKYLSNVIDDNTGKISEPFNIGDKNYRMVRGIKPNREVVLSVMCLEDKNIYEVEQFEKEIALPMKEMLEKQNSQETTEKEDIDEIKEMGLSEYKHYVVNEKKNSFKKFKTIQELVKNGLSNEEKYMNLREFKKYYENKIFGKKQITGENSNQ